MRDIKFRGMTSKGWLYGDLIHNRGKVYIAPVGEIYHGAIQEDFEVTDVNSIGQFTGLKDALGRDLYEGDIIESSYGNRHFIKYDYSNGAFVAVPYSDDDFSVPRYLVNSWILKFRKRIVGNIYDNKDLMKEGKK